MAHYETFVVNGEERTMLVYDSKAEELAATAGAGDPVTGLSIGNLRDKEARDPYNLGRPEAAYETEDPAVTAARAEANKTGKPQQVTSGAKKGVVKPSRVTPPGVPGDNRLSGSANRPWSWKAGK